MLPEQQIVAFCEHRGKFSIVFTYQVTESMPTEMYNMLDMAFAIPPSASTMQHSLSDAVSASYINLLHEQMKAQQVPIVCTQSEFASTECAT